MLIDGVPLYNVSHMLGLFSAFSPEAVKQVTLYKGFFPAKYGGRSSSVIDVRMLTCLVYLYRLFAAPEVFFVS